MAKCEWEKCELEAVFECECNQKFCDLHINRHMVDKNHHRRYVIAY